MQPEQAHTASELLNSSMEAAGMEEMAPGLVLEFAAYVSLFLRWNHRVNLTAARDEKTLISRHLVECIACANALPFGLCSVLDFGSGGGLPGIPIALCRPHISVTLAESQGRKAAFLRETVRQLGLEATVHGDRAETLDRTFDCVTLRAVDRMAKAVRTASALVAEGGFLALMTTLAGVEEMKIAGNGRLNFEWQAPIALPGGVQRVLLLGKRIAEQSDVAQTLLESGEPPRF